MLEWLKVAASVLYDRPMRCRLLGMRPVVICLLQASNDNDRFLFINPSEKPVALMPPQEGIEPNESVEQAVERGVNVELGIAETDMHFRRSVWLGSKTIPEQHGERDIAYSLFKMRGKAYYAALVRVPSDVTLRLNSAEIAASQWVTVEEIRTALATNSDRKKWVIKQAFRKLLSIDLDDNQTKGKA
jgi:putative (di)nucleoside polyphosphate hydrolase